MNKPKIIWTKEQKEIEEMKVLFATHAQHFVDWSLEHTTEEERKKMTKGHLDLMALCFMQGAMFGRAQTLKTGR